MRNEKIFVVVSITAEVGWNETEVIIQPEYLDNHRE